MDKETYTLLENYMLSCMSDEDIAHDKAHVYRVLYAALEIAAAEENVDADVLIAACLLHDIGRPEQLVDPEVCHAQVGAKKAKAFLLENGFDAGFAEKVEHCISVHRFRDNNPPVSIEEKILFDADKLEITGALGVARVLLYAGEISEPLYSLDENGNISDGKADPVSSFFNVYHAKLKKVYDRFYTQKGREIAEARREACTRFYDDMLSEVRRVYDCGRAELEKLVE